MEIEKLESILADLLTEKFGGVFETVAQVGLSWRHVHLNNSTCYLSFHTSLMEAASKKEVKDKVSRWIERDSDLIKEGAWLSYDEHGEPLLKGKSSTFK
ncbi:hypothetical protein [Vibrio cholerae]|uniref:hypothetical protein n=1 Tax=Vibrio cholerae TaxID=666 RepID=UPI00308095A9